MIALTTFPTTKGGGRAGGALVPRKTRLAWNGKSLGTLGSSSRAEARFELDNVGDETVRVLAVESGCGCARPTVRPSVIPPGQSTTVYVSALTVPVGYKDVRFTVHTDSTETPEVPLTLRIMGMREPPFLFMFWGDLQFRGIYSPELSREITVATVEPRNHQDHPAVEVSSDLPFLEIEPTGVEDQPYANSDAILHKRRFKVRFTTRPAGAFEGTLTAKDPWDPHGTKTLAVAGKFDSGMTVTPGRIIFAGSEAAEVSLIVITERLVSDLEWDVEGPPDLPLKIEEPGPGQTGRVPRLTVTFKGSPSGWVGQAHIKVRMPESAEAIAIPVTISAK